MDVIAKVVGGRFIQRIPVDVVVDLRKREVEHAEGMILVLSLRGWKHRDCDVLTSLSPRALDQDILVHTYGIRICIKEPHVLSVVRPVLVAQIRHAGLASLKHLTRESSCCHLYRSATHRFIGKGRELLTVIRKRFLEEEAHEHAI